MLSIRRLVLEASVVMAAVSTLTISPTLTGYAVAHAKSSPTVVGQKYSDAKSALSDAGFSAVVASTVGDRVAWADCIVVSQHDRSRPAPPNSSGSATAETLVSLNCEKPVASATDPGNSKSSPEGRAAAASATNTAPSPGGG